MTKRFEIIVKGRVQGVFFRASAQETAKKYNIKGFAQNLPDGSVLIEAEGDEDDLGKFIQWCHRGPVASQVVAVEINELTIQNDKEFVIKH